MQSSGTSTPAGDSPGPGRAFLRTTDFTPEIVPPRLRRTTYPAGQSPLVLPGLTRASSSFTITSNHQNILPLWPAAPPPGQPVVFFLSAVRRPSGLLSFCPAAWSVQGGEGRDSPVPWSMRSALPDTRQGRGIFPFRVPVFEGAAALRPVRSRSPGHQGRTAFVCGALRCARCPAGFGRPGVAALLLRTLPALGQDARAARPSQMARRTSARGNSPFLSSSSFFLIMETPSAVRLLCGRGAARLTRAASPAVIRRHKKRRPPAWRPADVWSRFTDAARGIRTACRAGKRWPRNRRPARRHCSTGHGSGSWPGSCARRTWA